VSTPIIVYVLTCVAGLIVLSTRLRLGRPTGRIARASAVSGLLTIYVASGLLGLLGWLMFLVFPDDSMVGDPLVGVIALFFWWIATLMGLRIANRPAPQGKHAASAGRDRRSRRSLLMVGQVVLLLTVGFFTWAYTTAAV
jgi:hypothetical protein